jgi:hypothetical protein
MTATTRARPVPRTYSKHGLTVLKRGVLKLGGRVLDMRTTVGKALTDWRGELLRDLGGAEAVTTQQLAIVDLAVKTKLILDSIDAWCFAQPTLINRRRRSVLPVVRERQQLADSLAKYMNMLGLERRTKPIQSLGDYVASRYSNDGAQTTRESVTEHEEDSS